MIKFERALETDAKILVEIQKRAFLVDVAICGEGPPGYDSVDYQMQIVEISLIASTASLMSFLFLNSSINLIVQLLFLNFLHKIQSIISFCLINPGNSIS